MSAHVVPANNGKARGGTRLPHDPASVQARRGGLVIALQPLNYEAVRRLLGHTQLQTPINFYVGLESIAAARQYQEMLLRDMQEDEA